MEPFDGAPRTPRLPRQVGQTLTELAHVTNELVRATTVDAVTTVVTEHMADAVGATIAALGLRHGPDEARLIGVRGLPEAEATAWWTFPLDTRNSMADAIANGKRIVVVGAAEISRRYPAIAGRGERTIVTVPLRGTESTLGAIHLSIPEAAPPHPAALEFIDVLADTCAQALERIEAAAVAEKQTSRLAFLAEASIQLASSLDVRSTTAKMVRMTVPRYADWCAVDVVRGGTLRRLASAHTDPAATELVAAMRDRWPEGAADGSWLDRVVETGRPLLVPDVTDDVLDRTARDAGHRAALTALDLRSVLIVPLFVRGRVAGLLTWGSSRPGRHYDEDDVRFAEHLARRAASALDNADLYGQTRAVAEQLQRAVLPELLSGDDDFEVAWRYEPSGRTEVGGDFYDAFTIGDGRHVAFVGDVMGRGVAASAAMAQMRASVRAFASVDPTPESVLDALDRMVTRFENEQLVTLVYVLADARAGTVHVASAGHLPPLIAHPDGSVERLPDADGPPLGLADGRHGLELPFGPGDSLLLVTDGLVERRDEDLETGLTRLQNAMRALQGATLDDALSRLVRTVGDESADDDVAALVLRRTATGSSLGQGMASPRMSA
ncbi:SpoIIE family protein phosphatase [Arthrobacter sp. NEB 688]|uniref:GAF domain-containing SpoIIE family protein phosphatase n=1 Tax=Arthrobacter sp. NEB 688 TaxID=904039 RepID=UPI0015644256|nr:SpoIIE family protein phosphatase [Arthrobacter sp. NEB 688]QKE82865.1 SpoIIE family protein phosphatase [Arthrobacter sp. NEB 688]